MHSVQRVTTNSSRRYKAKKLCKQTGYLELNSETPWLTGGAEWQVAVIHEGSAWVRTMITFDFATSQATTRS